jgi:hypothetical protein
VNWLELNTVAAQRCFAELQGARRFAPSALRSDYARLRQELLAAIPTFSSDESSKGSYDIEVGLALYRLLGRLGFEQRTASSLGVWRHLSLAVVPDLVETRWPDRQQARFWSHRSRIWLRTVWWFVHLSWQTNEETTRAALHGVTTDDIVQLVERPGRQGYRVDLYRAMIRARSQRDAGEERFRELMVLNTARAVMTEPALHDSGLEGYVQNLYNQIDKTGRRKPFRAGK